MGTDDADKAVGLRVQAARESMEYNQSELARHLQDAGLPWSQGTLSRVETGLRAVRLTEAVTLAHVLGIGLTGLVPGAGGLDSALARASDREDAARSRIELAMSDLRTSWNLAQALRLAASLRDNRTAVHEVDRSAPRFLWDAITWSPLEDVGLYDLLGFLTISRSAIDDLRGEAEAFLSEYMHDTSIAFSTLLKSGPADFAMPEVGPGTDSGEPGYGEIVSRHVMLGAGRLLEGIFPGVTFNTSAADHATLRNIPIEISGFPVFTASGKEDSDAAPSA